MACNSSSKFHMLNVINMHLAAMLILLMRGDWYRLEEIWCGFWWHYVNLKFYDNILLKLRNQVSWDVTLCHWVSHSDFLNDIGAFICKV